MPSSHYFLRTILAGAALSLCAGAHAVADSGPYVAGHIGLTLPNDIVGEGVSDLGQSFVIDEEFDAGYRIGAALGYRFDLPAFDIRTELEVSYREHDVDDILLDGVSAPSSGGDASSLAAIANVYVDVEILPFINPYVGFGLGIAGVESDGEATLPFPVDGITDARFDGGTNTEFVFQLMLGNNIPLTDALAVFVDARYLRAAGADFALETATDGAIFGPTESDFEVFSLNVGLRVHF